MAYDEHTTTLSRPTSHSTLGVEEAAWRLADYTALWNENTYNGLKQSRLLTCSWLESETSLSRLAADTEGYGNESWIVEIMLPLALNRSYRKPARTDSPIVYSVSGYQSDLFSSHPNISIEYLLCIFILSNAMGTMTIKAAVRGFTIPYTSEWVRDRWIPPIYWYRKCPVN